ncbi:MAG: hypothetical protein JXA96_08855 [Sedimentisphaerales bacterium]|nr:hypothetical protein [Sedimentisphaerales bacterium]
MRERITYIESDCNRVEYRQKALCLLLLAFLLSSTPSAIYSKTPKPQAKPVRVLFVGNSYTSVNKLPLVVMALAQAKDIDLACNMSVAGGATLENHLKGEKELNTLEMIKSGKYNTIVLQDQSLRPIKSPKLTIKDIGQFCESINESEITPYLFMTWAREGNPQTQELLKKTFEQASKQYGAKVVPVGMAWQRALKQKSDIELYDEDGSHPSELGTYLSACVFFSALTGESPKGLAKEIRITDETGKTVFLLKISKQNAEFCQQVAEQTMKEFTSEQK